MQHFGELNNFLLILPLLYRIIPCMPGYRRDAPTELDMPLLRSFPASIVTFLLQTCRSSGARRDAPTELDMPLLRSYISSVGA
jgi:hypothetical protein